MLAEKLGIKKGLTAVIGSGGKTTLIRDLAYELLLKGTVIVAASTKIYPPDYCETIVEENDSLDDQILDKLSRFGLVAVGRKLTLPNGEEKLFAPVTSFDKLCRLADYVLVEADGSKHLPLKAHNEDEPVIPACAGRTVLVTGLGGLFHSISDVAHRCDRFAELAGCQVSDKASIDTIATVLNKEALGDIVYITQITDDYIKAIAQQLAGMLEKETVLSDIRLPEARRAMN